MFFWCFPITVIAVYWVEHGLAIRKNVRPPEGVTYTGGSLGREADCKNTTDVACDNIWWLENSKFGDLFVSRGPRASVTFNFSGDQIYVYGVPPSDNGAIAIFTLDDMPPQPVNTANVSQVGSDPTVLWSNQTLDAGNHTLSVKYDSQSREDGEIRYLILNYFSYNDPSEVFSLSLSPNSQSSSTLPAPTVQLPGDGKFTPNDREVTWIKYVAPVPTLGAVLSTAVVLLLLGTTIFLCKRRRKRWRDALVPDPFIDIDNFSNSMMNHIHPTTAQDSTDLSEQYLRHRPNVEPVQAHRDFPPPPRPPPTLTSINYGDQIAETLSTISLNEQESSVYQPRGTRLYIPGRRPSDSTPHYT